MTATNQDTTPDLPTAQENLFSVPNVNASTYVAAAENAKYLFDKLSPVLGDAFAKKSAAKYMTDWETAQKRTRAAWVEHAIELIQSIASDLHELGLNRTVRFTVAPKSATPFTAKRGPFKGKAVNYALTVERPKLGKPRNKGAAFDKAMLVLKHQ